MKHDVEIKQEITIRNKRVSGIFKRTQKNNNFFIIIIKISL